MVADISQASTLPVEPTRFAARIVWLPAPQARSRTRMPGPMPAISMSVSVADDRPAENSRSHFAQPGAAFSQVSRSLDFDALSDVSEASFPDFIAIPEGVSTLPMNSLLSKSPCVASKAKCPLWVKSRHMQCNTACPLYPKSGHLVSRDECTHWPK